VDAAAVDEAQPAEVEVKIALLLGDRSEQLDDVPGIRDVELAVQLEYPVVSILLESEQGLPPLPAVLVDTLRLARRSVCPEPDRPVSTRA